MIYLDNNSTTPVDPRVLESMLPFFSDQFGNASSSTHEMGRQANRAVEESRETIAGVLGVSPDEIYFTSGATESNNLAIRGFATHRSTRTREIVSATTEHRAVLDPVKRLGREGFRIHWLEPSGRTGEFDLGSLENVLSDETSLVSLMWANNEIGTCLPIHEIAALCTSKGATLHCDAVQAFGRVPVNLRDLPVHLLSISGHKIYGPKGIGALYVRRGTRLKALVDGGGHEGGKRSGTLNVPGIVGLGRAVQIAQECMESEETRIRELMRICDQLVLSKVEKAILNGPALDDRLLGNLNYELEGIDAETLTLNLQEVCISTGSACTSAEPGPSHVLQAIGLNETQARASIRIGIGRFNSKEEIELAVEKIADAARNLRSQAS